MAGSELFFDPLQGGREKTTIIPAPATPHPSAPEDPAHRRSLELLRVRDELEKMSRAGKRA